MSERSPAAPTVRGSGHSTPLAKQLLSLAAVGAAALASFATTIPRTERNYPTWKLGDSERAIGCASLRVEVGRAGKEGLGLLLEASANERCEVTVVAAVLELTGAKVEAQLPPAVQLEPGTAGRLWLPFSFAAEERWNSGDRRATVRLRVRAGSAEKEWLLPAEHVLDGFHRPAPDRPEDELLASPPVRPSGAP